MRAVFKHKKLNARNLFCLEKTGSEVMALNLKGEDIYITYSLCYVYIYR